jgi:cytochrome P450 family 4
LVIPTLEIHRDKSIWGEDALEFKPERFIDENFKNIHPYAYIPFSNGSRMCPGYKYAMITMKIFLSRFITKYQVSTTAKFKNLKFSMGFTPVIQENPDVIISKKIHTQNNRAT